MGCILPSKRVEVVYRITAPLPIRVTVLGIEWELYIWQGDYPPYFSVKLGRVDHEAEFAPLFTADSFAEAQHMAGGLIRCDYPHSMIPYIRQLIRDGNAEAVWGPHTQLYYQDPEARRIAYRYR